jgi:hypothetical protein
MATTKHAHTLRRHWLWCMFIYRSYNLSLYRKWHVGQQWWKLYKLRQGKYTVTKFANTKWLLRSRKIKWDKTIQWPEVKGQKKIIKQYTENQRFSKVNSNKNTSWTQFPALLEAPVVLLCKIYDARQLLEWKQQLYDAPM